MTKRTPDFLCFKLGKVMRKVQSYYQSRLLPLGLTPTQLYVLNTLSLEDGMTLSDLGERIALDSSTLTGVIDRMERDSLVRRQSDREDRRAIRVYLTGRAREIGPEAQLMASEFDKSLRSTFPAEDIAVFDRVLAVLAEMEDMEFASGRRS